MFLGDAPFPPGTDVVIQGFLAIAALTLWSTPIGSGAFLASNSVVGGPSGVDTKCRMKLSLFAQVVAELIAKAVLVVTFPVFIGIPWQLILREDRTEGIVNLNVATSAVFGIDAISGSDLQFGGIDHVL